MLVISSLIAAAIAFKGNDLPSEFFLAVSIPAILVILYIGFGQSLVYGHLRNQIPNLEAQQTIKNGIDKFAPYFSAITYLQIYLLYNFAKLYDLLVWKEFEDIKDSKVFLSTLPSQFQMILVLFIVFFPLFLSFQNFFHFFNADKLWSNFKKDLKIA
ncbi:hypothetical protein [Bdellovibrio sp. HCB2-146]|uniref:hypothetical protein n=1 Tax=Bdellovibrio sp. HCB2-146 TaxID=3394362 RepID=UPI0039BCC11C